MNPSLKSIDYSFIEREVHKINIIITWCGKGSSNTKDKIIFRSYVPEHVETHRVSASSITASSKKDLIAKRSNATALHNWVVIMGLSPLIVSIEIYPRLSNCWRAHQSTKDEWS